MIENPTPYLVVAFSVLFGATVAAALSKINGDRAVVQKARQIVGTNDTLQTTVDALQVCNDALTDELEKVKGDLVAALKRIAHLESIIEDMSTIREIKRRRIAAANEEPDA